MVYSCRTNYKTGVIIYPINGYVTLQPIFIETNDSMTQIKQKYAMVEINQCYDTVSNYYLSISENDRQKLFKKITLLSENSNGEKIYYKYVQIKYQLKELNKLDYPDEAIIIKTNNNFDWIEICLNRINIIEISGIK